MVTYRLHAERAYPHRRCQQIHHSRAIRCIPGPLSSDPFPSRCTLLLLPLCLTWASGELQLFVCDDVKLHTQCSRSAGGSAAVGCACRCNGGTFRCSTGSGHRANHWCTGRDGFFWSGAGPDHTWCQEDKAEDSNTNKCSHCINSNTWQEEELLLLVASRTRFK